MQISYAWINLKWANTIFVRYIIIQLISIFLVCSCGKKSESQQNNFGEMFEKDSIISEDVIPLAQHEEEDLSLIGVVYGNSADSFFTSYIRPEEKLYTNQQYIDTVDYLDFIDDGDYWTIAVKKDTFDIWLINGLPQDEISYRDLKAGERVVIIWEMDTIWVDGDVDPLWVREWLRKMKKLNN